uniref:Abelson helper integration site 1 n=1 Tax=Electrophorus electricus TaxID=8005 RepID=A0A4W4GRG9_ELEEL
SPRFSKNRRREEEEVVSEKANIIINDSEEKPSVTSVKKKSKRTLPPPPNSLHDEEESDRSAQSIQSDTVQEDKEDAAKPKRQMKNKRKEEVKVSQRQVFDDSLVLGVYIHRADRLKTDFLVSHPMVKVHVVDEMTGHYVKKEDSHRRVSSFYEQEDIEHILPIITQPFDFKKNKSTVPEWEEQVIFNERFGYFLQDGEESSRVILFFELVGTNGMLNINSKLRLQLYSSPPRTKKTTQTVEVFHWWSKCPRDRYASTLYVTVKGIKLPEHVDPGVRSMMALQQERGSTTYSELHTHLSQKTSTLLPESRSEPMRWSRIPGQVCRIPNKLVLSLRGGQMGCFTLRFSHDGCALAAACADRDAFPVVVWNVERLQALAQKILPHPSFLYCVQCHPHMQNLVVTAGYDGLLRVWNLDVKDVNGQLLQEFEGHKTFVNAMCFDSEGTRMFSADSAGLIIVWNTKTEPESRHGPTRHWNIEKQIRESDLNGIPINSLEVHPNGRRLLVHAKDSVLRVMDLRILAVKKYIGATNYTERINSTFSPCGGFIYSGSEDGLAYVWNAETGDQVAVYSELGYPTALRGVAYHPHEHMVAFCAFGQSQPIHLYLYDRKVALLEVESMRSLRKAETVVSKPAKNPAELKPVLDASISEMDQFTSAARMSLKLQRVKQKLDSVLGLNVFLPPPSLVSPHSKLQLSSSLSDHLIPQATLSSQTFGLNAFGQAIRRVQSLKQRVKHSAVVSLYDYRANRSDELTFRRGDVIHVLYKDNDSWWFGCLASGQKGYFPTAYVAEESGFDEELSHALEAQPRPSEQRSQEVDRLAPAKLSAAISATGEFKIISEQDTDVEAPSVKYVTTFLL